MISTESESVTATCEHVVL